MGPPIDIESEEALNLLQMLWDMMKKYLGNELNLRFNLGHEVEKITFSDLWYIFKPGDEVRTPGESRIQL